MHVLNIVGLAAKRKNLRPPQSSMHSSRKACAHSAHQRNWYILSRGDWRCRFVTFTVRRGLSAADKSRLSEAMLEAQVAAGYHRADRFHRFLEVDQDDLLVDPRFPDYATDQNRSAHGR